MSLKILWVDDEEMLRFLGKELLEILGHSVEVAENGLVALEKMDDTFDLVVSDILMPVMDGWELAEKIKELYKCKIILISGLYIESISQENLEKYKVDYILEKPIHGKTLRTLLNKLEDELRWK